MSDIFLSYSSLDRERVLPLHDALVGLGFEVFWDQKLPPGVDWDAWIRERLTDARAAMVVWTRHSIQSKNVRHEAIIAQGQDKLVSVLFDAVPPAQFPMGLFTVQAADLTAWSGAPEDAEFQKLSRWLESKLTPTWLKGVLEAKDHVLSDERTARGVAEGQQRTLRDQAARDLNARLHLQDERDRARGELEQLQLEANVIRQKVEETTASRDAALQKAQEAQTRSAQLEARLAQHEAALTATRSTSRRRWGGSGLVLASTVIGLVYLYQNAVGDRERVETELAAAVKQQEAISTELTTAREEQRLTLQRLEEAQRRAAAAPAVTPATAPAVAAAPPPEPCPDIGAARFWAGANTFAISSAFARRCVEDSADQFASSDSEVAKLFKPNTGVAGSAQFVAYVLSVNGLRVNPTTCNGACLQQGLRETTRPTAGDVVVFNNDTFGVYADDGGFFELISNKDVHTVSHRTLSRAEVKAFLSVTTAKSDSSASEK